MTGKWISSKQIRVLIAKIQEILRAGPKNIRLSDQHWAYIIDSGGQPAYQELLALFVRAASLNIITLDLSKPFDESARGNSIELEKKIGRVVQWRHN